MGAANGTSVENNIEDDTISAKSENTTMEQMTLGELDAEFPFMNWTRSFSFLPISSSVNISSATTIYIQKKEYLRSLTELFSRHSRKTIDNYLCWSFVARFLPYMGNTVRKLYEDFRRDVPEPDDSRSESNRVFLARWKECVHLTCEGLKLPTALLYSLERGEKLQRVKTVAFDMISRIKAAFIDIIDQQPWIANVETKQKLKQRIESIESRVAFPSVVSDAASIDDMFSSLEVNEDGVFLSNILNVTRHEVILDLQKVGEKPDPEKEWLMQPLVANAYFDSINDDISKFFPVFFRQHESCRRRLILTFLFVSSLYLFLSLPRQFFRLAFCDIP